MIIFKDCSKKNKMLIGVLSLKLYIAGNASLKDKRRVIKALKDKLRNRFNVAVSEVGNNDVWQNAELAVATVGTDKRHVNSLLSHVVKFVESSRSAEIISFNTELI